MNSNRDNTPFFIVEFREILKFIWMVIIKLLPYVIARRNTIFAIKLIQYVKCFNNVFEKLPFKSIPHLIYQKLKFVLVHFKFQNFRHFPNVLAFVIINKYKKWKRGQLTNQKIIRFWFLKIGMEHWMYCQIIK